VRANDAVPVPYPTKQLSVNVVDLWWNYAIGNTNLPDQAMTDACGRGFTYLRFGASLLWPSQMQFYLNNETQYWNLFDTLWDSAEKRGCQLIPSIFWHWWVFADMMGEPLSHIFMDGTKVRNAMFDYTTKLVSRYSNRSTLLFWELGNELNLWADQDMSTLPVDVNPSMGTPDARTKADNFTTDMMIGFQQDMIAQIRSADKFNHLITSGFSAPRPAAEHLRASYYLPDRDWTADNETEYQKNLLDIHLGLDLIGVHIYGGPDNVRFDQGWDENDAGFTNFTKQVADQAGKPLYLGEYGSVYNTTSDPDRVFSTNILAAIVGQKIYTSTLWVWEFYWGDEPDMCTIMPGRDDAFIDKMIATNKQLLQ